MAKSSKSKKNAESRELLEALTILEKEKNISKDTLLEAIENSLLTACKNHFGKADNIKVTIDPETCEFHVYARTGSDRSADRDQLCRGNDDRRWSWTWRCDP